MPRLEPVPEAHIDFAYGIYFLDQRHRLIRALKKRYMPSIHGHKTWGSSFLLMDYLTHYGLRRGAGLMELGCGWGGVSVFCAHRFRSRVTGVDLDPAVFPYVDVLAELNEVTVRHLQADFTNLPRSELVDQCYLVGSDICFWDSLVKPLGQLVARSFEAGVERVVIADPGRPTFYEFCDLMAEDHKVDLQAWYSIEPNRFEGEVIDIRPRS